jgi:hypothetical protein
MCRHVVSADRRHFWSIWLARPDNSRDWLGRSAFALPGFGEASRRSAPESNARGGGWLTPETTGMDGAARMVVLWIGGRIVVFTETVFAA